MRSKEFDSKEWIENKNDRYRMINHLMASDLIIGKTKNTVIEIIGEEYKEDCLLSNTFCYIAYDPDNFAFLDHYELVVHFDENNKVKKVSYELI